jgi:hypothetical protein
MWAVDFSSDKFRPFLPDDSQVNPGCAGFELAAWMSRTLAAKDVITSYPECEDWGWYILYTTPDGRREIMIACGQHPDKHETPLAEILDWRVFIKQRKNPGPQELEALKLLKAGIVSVLSDEGIPVREIVF